MCAGLDAIGYFERRFPDLDKMPTTGDNANCAEWLLSITTKVAIVIVPKSRGIVFRRKRDAEGTGCRALAIALLCMLPNLAISGCPHIYMCHSAWSAEELHVF